MKGEEKLWIAVNFVEVHRLQVRIWARRKAIDDRQGDYALNVTGRILQFYEQYYNAKYPLPKSGRSPMLQEGDTHFSPVLKLWTGSRRQTWQRHLYLTNKVFEQHKWWINLFLNCVQPDQIALPDFHAGAMENWGLITYRETALLYDPIISSTGNKERVVTVIAHELAHMVCKTYQTRSFTTLFLQGNSEFGQHSVVPDVKEDRFSWRTWPPPAVQMADASPGEKWNSQAISFILNKS